MSIALIVTISFWAGVIGGGLTVWYWTRPAQRRGGDA